MRKSNKSVKLLYGLTENTGYGHFKRTTVLSAYLKEKGFKTSCHQIIGNIDDTFFQNECDLVIVDTPEIPNSRVADYIKNSKTSLGLDWFFDINLDYNIVIYNHGKKPCAKTKVFEGFDYVIVDNRISNLKPSKTLYNPKNALVVIGGTDCKNDGYKAAEILLKNRLKVHLVLGHLHTSETLSSKNFGKIKISTRVEDLSPLINNADIMVTNGGGCLFEAMTSGRPAISIAQSKNEQNIIDFLKNKDALAGTSLKELHDLQEKKWVDISSKASEIVDGYGAMRVSSIVTKILEQTL